MPDENRALFVGKCRVRPRRGDITIRLANTLLRLSGHGQGPQFPAALSNVSPDGRHTARCGAAGQKRVIGVTYPNNP